MSNSSEESQIFKKYLEESEKRKQNIRAIIYILNLALDWLTFGFVSELVHLSLKNPFKDHIIGDLNNYFYDTEESTIIKNNIFEGIKNNNSTFLRKLVSLSICKEVRESFIEFKGLKLSEIFDFNLDKIRLYSIISLCIMILMDIIAVVIFVIFIKIYCKLFCGKEIPDKKDFFSKMLDKVACVEIMGIILRVMNVARFVISLIIYHYIETSDLDKYDDFLDCKNVKRKFFEEFSDAEKLRKCFYIYLALEIAKQGMEKLNQNFGIEPDKPPEPSENSKQNNNEESVISSTPV